MSMSNSSPFVGEFHFDSDFVAELDAHPEPPTRVKPLAVTGSPAMLVEGLLTDEEVEALMAQLDAQEWVPVGTNGILADYNAARGDQIGSYRASCFDEHVVAVLFKRLAAIMAPYRTFARESDGQPQTWKMIGVNPLMRFIKYRSGGLLVPHYDAPYDYGDGRCTQVTLVLYLRKSPQVSGGATRFISDPQTELPVAERDFSDWERLARPEEVALRVEPQPGAVLLFDHRVLHDSEAISSEGEKVIMRTDVLFERQEA